MNRRARLLLIAAVLLPVDVAIAHAPLEGASGFSGGALHPLFVPAHALAILATGLLVGQQAPRRPWPAACYGGGLLAGLVAIASAVAPELAGEAVLAAAAASGALVGLARPIPALLINALALVTGLALALDSPPQAVSLQEANATLAGTFCGAVVLLLVVVEGTTLLRRDWQRIGMRILGSWTAASAIMALTLRLAR